MELIIATHNQGKLQEIRTILGKIPVRLLSLQQFPHIPGIKETGRTYEANARQKALTLFKATGLPVLAEDSGLEVRALGNRPGIYSARYAGANATASLNNQKLLQELKSRPIGRGSPVWAARLKTPLRQPHRPACANGRQAGSRVWASGKENPRAGKVPLSGRRACYRCVAILIIPSTKQLVYAARGTCRGKIAPTPRGKNGFGYDPLFIPCGYRKTFGELPDRIKNRLSHRAKALRKIKPVILKYFT